MQALWDSDTEILKNFGLWGCPEGFWMLIWFRVCREGRGRVCACVHSLRVPAWCLVLLSHF